MGADDFHVSVDAANTESYAKLRAKKMRKYNRIEKLALKWFDGEISDRRMAEAVFGLINKEAHNDY